MKILNHSHLLVCFACYKHQQRAVVFCAMGQSGGQVLVLQGWNGIGEGGGQKSQERNREQILPYL